MQARQTHHRHEHVRGALLALAVAGSTGCFLYLSPDDSWDDAYGLASLDASETAADTATSSEPGVADTGASPEAGTGPCAHDTTQCVPCCDKAFGLAAGGDFFAAVWSCACPGRCAPECGGNCTADPPPSDVCLACLAANTKSPCASAAIPRSCPAASACYGYAACIQGCAAP